MLPLRRDAGENIEILHFQRGAFVLSSASMKSTALVPKAMA